MTQVRVDCNQCGPQTIKIEYVRIALEPVGIAFLICPTCAGRWSQEVATRTVELLAYAGAPVVLAPPALPITDDEVALFRQQIGNDQVFETALVQLGE